MNNLKQQDPERVPVLQKCLNHLPSWYGALQMPWGEQGNPSMQEGAHTDGKMSKLDSARCLLCFYQKGLLAQSWKMPATGLPVPGDLCSSPKDWQVQALTCSELRLFLWRRSYNHRIRDPTFPSHSWAGDLLSSHGLLQPGGETLLISLAWDARCSTCLFGRTRADIFLAMFSHFLSVWWKTGSSVYQKYSEQILISSPHSRSWDLGTDG